MSIRGSEYLPAPLNNLRWRFFPPVAEFLQKLEVAGVGFCRSFGFLQKFLQDALSFCKRCKNDNFTVYVLRYVNWRETKTMIRR